MNLPKKNFSMKIGPFDWEVIYSSDVGREGDCFGSTHTDEQKIFLDPKYKGQKIDQTFIHEIFHACTFVSGLVYRLDDGKQHVEEEDVVRVLSMIYYQVMVDNPNIFSYERKRT